MSARARVLALLPARAPEDERRWIEAFVAQLARWTVLTAVDPGLPGEEEGGRVFANRAWNDFREQVKESIFEHPIELVVAVGRAALARNLGLAAGWAPLVPRAGVWLGSDWLRLISGKEDRRACFSLCDLVLMSGDWRSGRLHDSVVEFAHEPQAAARRLEERFGLHDARRGELPELGRPGVTVIAGDARTAAAARRLLGRAAAAVLDAGDGAPAGWNRALARAATARVLLLQKGACVSLRGLQRLHEYLDGDVLLAAAAACAAAGPARAHEARALDAAQAAHSLRGKGHREHARLIPPACWLARRSAFVRAGRFDESFATYAGAVADFSFRVRQAGLRALNASDVLCWPSGPAVSVSPDLDALKRKWTVGLTRSLLAMAKA